MEHLFKIRRELHQIPEPAHQEYKTHDYLYNHLQQFAHLLRIHTFSFPGILAEYSGAKKGEHTGCYLFRADMDALPVKEKTGCEFCSGHSDFMHACGHDIHMTVLLGLIEHVVQNKIEKNILFLFQPAEEGQGGAQKILKTGIFDNYEVTEAYALHVKPGLPVGTVSCRSGVIFGIPQEFDVIFRGNSSHAANPQAGRDAICAASHFIANTPSMLAKFLPPHQDRLFHIGKISGGSIRNIVAEECKVEGTLRVLEDMESLKKVVFKSAALSASFFDVKEEIILQGRYDPVVNSGRLYKKLQRNLPQEVLLKEAVPALTGEDFGFFTSRYEGLLFWVGAGENPYDLHSPYFLPDERAILTGLNIFLSLLMN